jgi:hypothetical protein
LILVISSSLLSYQLFFQERLLVRHLGSLYWLILQQLSLLLSTSTGAATSLSMCPTDSANAVVIPLILNLGAGIFSRQKFKGNFGGCLSDIKNVKH